MPASPIEIPTSDGRKLAGTLYTPSLAPAPFGKPHQLPALILAPTFTATQTMGAQNWAQHFTSHLWLAVVTFDARGFGQSQGEGFVPQEALPAAQIADLQDAITFAAAHELIDPGRIALWGSGLSGGHVLHVAAVDKRVRAVISQAPMVDGWETLARRVRHDVLPDLEARFAADHTARAKGGAASKPGVVPVVCDPSTPEGMATICALPGRDSWAHFGHSKDGWVNEVTLRSLEAIRGYVPATLVARISPAPLLMVVARDDRVCGADLALAAYERALQPKEVRFVDGGHYSVYGGEKFEGNVEGQIVWLKGVFGLALFETGRLGTALLHLLLLLPDLLALAAPSPAPAPAADELLEAKVGVEDVEHQARHGDHDALEPDEQALPAHQGPVPPATQLGDAVHAPPEDARRRQRQRAQEPAEGAAAAQAPHGLGLVERGLAEPAVAAPGAHRKVGRDGDEDEQRQHLEAQARDHDVVARARRGAAVRGDRGDAAARGLQHERDDVAGDEDARVVRGRDARVGGAERAHDAPQAEVDAGGHEGRPDGQADDLHEEPLLLPGVLPAHDAPRVAEDLAERAQDEGRREGVPAAGGGAGEQEEQAGEGEEGEEGGVGGEVEVVQVVAADALAAGRLGQPLAHGRGDGGPGHEAEHVGYGVRHGLGWEEAGSFWLLILLQV
ncbi:uncharacterized protein E0L32_007152 [Thyridium curvatum]|uniref:AB hydrolase-1 domain-containing protein n=1 Tax=Thyridium curvatum TaxID=1093900 RepID=A0A507AZM8_9PEZI|nr:uncharacterized protein E0L32_007152 [Thyridium curvatum]TPX12266.1 hypothetical protein E0L32_007152 [Thyridium curvatum]